MEPGSQLGPYLLDAELGRGAMGVVYRARHAELGHAVALKVLRPEGPQAAEFVRRFEREAQAAAALDGHPNLVGVRGIGRTGDGAWWMAMELVDGASLADRVAGEALPWRDAVQLCAGVARGLAAAHAAGLIHRDVKPANILIAADGTPKLADFGLVAAADADPELTRLTHSNTILGTPAYMPAEQLRGGAVDGRSDVYALGATLFECCAGAPPFHGFTIYETVQRALQDERPALNDAGVEVPPALERILSRCLALDPNHRYARADALAEDLEALAGGREVAATFAPQAAKLRRRFAWIVGGLVITAVAAAAGGVLWWSGRAQQQKTHAIARAAEQRSLADRAADYSAAHAYLTNHAGAELSIVLDRFCGAPVRAADLDAALHAIRTVAAAARERHPESRLPDAWEQWSAVAADRDADPLPRLDARSKEADDDPYPDLLVVRFALLRYVAQLRVGSIDSTVETEVGAVPEGPAQQAIRAAATRLADRATTRAAWPLVALGAETRRFVEGARLFASQDWEACLSPLRDAATLPELEAESRTMIGLALFHLHRYRDAAQALEVPARREWRMPLVHAGLAWMMSGIREGRTAAVQHDAFVRATDYLVAAQRADGRADDVPGMLALAFLFRCKTEPTPEGARAAAEGAVAAGLRAVDADAREVTGSHPHRLTRTTLGRAFAARAALRDASPAEVSRDTDAATRQFDRLLEESPGAHYVRFERAKAGYNFFLRSDAARADRVAALERAVADYERAIAEGLTVPTAHRDAVAGLVDLGIAAKDAAKKEAYLRRAIERADAFVAQLPDAVAIRNVRVHARVELGQFLSRLGRPDPRVLPAALDDLAIILQHQPTNYTAHFNAALCRRVAARVARSAGRPADADYAAAAKHVAAVIELAPKWNRPYRFRAWVHEEWGKLDASERFFAEGLARFPQDQFLVTGLKRVRAKLGK